MSIQNISTDKANKPTPILISLFWALLAALIIIASVLVSGWFDLLPEEYAGIIVPSAFALSLLLSIPELIFTIRQRLEKLFKGFLILTGASALGIFVSFVLHNAIYAIFIYFFGEGFWERIGIGDEPFFFVLAVIICPIAFLVGIVGSIVLFVKRRRIS